MLFSIKYTVMRLLRKRSNLFWILCFPIILGIFFHVAFSNIDATEAFEPIPAAVVGISENEQPEDMTLSTFQNVLAGISDEKKDDRMLTLTYCDEKKAMKLLEEKKIVGILTAGEKIKLTISSDQGSEQMNQSILNAFVDQYNIDSAILTETAMTHPERLEEMIGKLTETVSCREDVDYAYRSTGVYIQFFYNLIGMACLYTAIGGVAVALENQGNLSALAARKNISSTAKGITIAAELVASIFVEFLLNLAGYLFMVFVLGVDMAFRMPLAVLAIFVSTMTGISLGFMIGSIGKKGENFKVGMVFLIVMPCCFLSGLMVGNMRMIVERTAPWFNHINPAALISDCFYSLTAYESLFRYSVNLLTLCGLTVVFTVCGIFLTRRSRYASI